MNGNYPRCRQDQKVLEPNPVPERRVHIEAKRGRGKRQDRGGEGGVGRGEGRRMHDFKGKKDECSDMRHEMQHCEILINNDKIG